MLHGHMKSLEIIDGRQNIDGKDRARLTARIEFDLRIGYRTYNGTVEIRIPDGDSPSDVNVEMLTPTFSPATPVGFALPHAQMSTECERYYNACVGPNGKAIRASATSGVHIIGSRIVQRMDFQLLEGRGSESGGW